MRKLPNDKLKEGFKKMSNLVFWPKLGAEGSKGVQGPNLVIWSILKVLYMP